MLDPILIIIALVCILLFFVFFKRMIRIAVILGIIFIILLIMYPKECGYNINNEIKECKCSGFLREGEKTNLCYGFCTKECVCKSLNETSGEFMEAECDI